jgi:hypothetical protein
MRMRIDDFKREDNTDLGGYEREIIHHRGHKEHRGERGKITQRRGGRRGFTEKRGASLGTPFSGMAWSAATGTPIGRFIPPNPRDGAELAFPGLIAEGFTGF